MTSAADRLLRAIAYYHEHKPDPSLRHAFLVRVAKNHMLTWQTLAEALRIERQLREHKA